ncbi:MAG: hypothetical protein IRY83_04375 [Chloroflexi bacterium]|nr:hypothetical protein [Chloroflexota bacterium]
MSRDPIPAFELHVVPAGEQAYQLALWQRAIPTNGRPGAPAHHLVTLGGLPLQVGLDQILATLRREGYRASVLSSGQRQPLPLSEEAGVRLGLLFLALKPLTKVSRMERIAVGLRSMPDEEAYYWFSKCVAARGRGHAQRALRILLAGE